MIYHGFGKNLVGKTIGTAESVLDKSLGEAASKIFLASGDQVT